jgi:hypothetical protein
MTAVIHDSSHRRPRGSDTNLEPVARCGREASFIVTLRHRKAAKDTEVKELKGTVAEQKSTIMCACTGS